MLKSVQQLAYDVQKQYKLRFNDDNSAEQNRLQSEGETDEKDNIVEGVIKGFDKSVSQLEDTIRDKQMEDGSNIESVETVIKIKEDSSRDSIDQSDYEESVSDDQSSTNAQLSSKSKDNISSANDESQSIDASKVGQSGKNIKHSSPKHKVASTLIDSSNDQYVLSRTSNPTEHILDMRLYYDLIYLSVGAFIGGLVFDLLKLPSFFGYILTGIVLGPTTSNKIKSLVQIETIAQVGVLFIMYALGTEFSVDKIRKHWRITALGGSLFTLFLITISVLLGSVVGLPVTQSVLIGSLISLSSTTVLLKCIGGLTETILGQSAVGILVLQDMALGLLLAVMPTLTQPVSWAFASSLLKAFVSTVLMMIVSWVIGRWVLQPVMRLLRQRLSEELSLLSHVAVCFSFVLVAEYFDLSTEVAVFMAGVSVTSHNHTSSSSLSSMARLENTGIDAIRDYFAALFFCTLGLHIYPQFLIDQAPLLIMMTVILMACKTMCMFLSLHLCLKINPKLSLQLGLGLSQVSEFAFIVASRAKSMDILSRDLYYAILGTTSISLLLTPFVWKVIKSSYKLNVSMQNTSKNRVQDDQQDAHLY
ncbi:hypothetical protein MIR68_012244 [Amoeboaphelidium protococcarum]|nr:hypothetical protein MIR68_012244 [Amoeboaphelidium protococcarum]